MASLEGEALFNWLYDKRGNTEDEISWNQFGDFSKEVAFRLASDWFPNSSAKEGQLQSCWVNHPKRTQAAVAAGGGQAQFHWVGFFGNSSPPSFTALWHWISSIFITKKDHLPNQSVKESSSLLLGSS